MDLANLDAVVARYLRTVGDARVPHKVRLHDLRHMAFWHGYYASVVGAMVAGETPDVLRGTYKAINRDAQAHNRHLDVDQSVAAISQAQARLLRDLARIAADQVIPYKTGGKRYTRDAYIATVVEHFEMHMRYLKKIAAGAPESFYVFHD